MREHCALGCKPVLTHAQRATVYGGQAAVKPPPAKHACTVSFHSQTHAAKTNSCLLCFLLTASMQTGLSRTKIPDLDTAWEAVKDAQRPRVHTFIATSPVHMEFKLRMSEDEVVEAAVTAVKHLRSQGCQDIEFSPEDAGRSERPFLYRVLSEVRVCGSVWLAWPTRLLIAAHCECPACLCEWGCQRCVQPV